MHWLSPENHPDLCPWTFPAHRYVFKLGDVHHEHPRVRPASMPSELAEFKEIPSTILSF